MGVGGGGACGVLARSMPECLGKAGITTKLAPTTAHSLAYVYVHIYIYT